MVYLPIDDSRFYVPPTPFVDGALSVSSTSNWAANGERWSPNDIANLLFWFDVANDSKVWQDTTGTIPAAPGDPVGRITPIFGTDVFTQGVAGSKPIRTGDGKALDFDGSADELFNSSRALIRTSITRVVWCKFDTHSASRNPIPFSQREAVTDDRGWGWHIEATTHPTNPDKMVTLHTAIAASVTVSSIAVPDNVDVCLAWSYSTTGGHKLYIDGVLVATNANTTQPAATTTNGMRIGRAGRFDTNWTAGLWYKGGIYSRALTDSEVQEIYDRSKP